MIRPNNRQRPIIAVLFIALVVYLYWPLLTLELPIHAWDAIRYFNVDKINNVWSVDYFISIFTNFTNGPQYRPLSFFLYQLVTKTLFQHHIWAYQALGLLIVFAICFYLFKILRHFKISFSPRFFVFIVFIMHPYYFPTHSNDMFFKYQATLLIFTYGLYRLVRVNRVDTKLQITLALLVLLSIPMHEGSIIFPLAWSVFVFVPFQIKKIKQFWIPFIPTLIYVVVRFLVMDIPQEGFMRVGFEHFPTAFLQYFDTSWSIPFHTYINEKVVNINWYRAGKFSFFVILSLIFYFRFKSKILFQILLVNFILLLPFLLLPNHIVFNRNYWTYPLFPMFIVIFLQFFFKSKYVKVAIMGILLALSFIKFKDHENFYYGLYKKRHRMLYQLKDQVEEKINKNPKNLVGIHVDLIRDISGWHGPNNVIPSFLALKLPAEKTYYLTISHKGVITKILIYGGCKYYLESNNGDLVRVRDMYYIPHEFKLSGFSKLMANQNRFPVIQL